MATELPRSALSVALCGARAAGSFCFALAQLRAADASLNSAMSARGWRRPMTVYLLMLSSMFVGSQIVFRLVGPDMSVPAVYDVNKTPPPKPDGSLRAVAHHPVAGATVRVSEYPFKYITTRAEEGQLWACGVFLAAMDAPAQDPEDRELDRVFWDCVEGRRWNRGTTDGYSYAVIVNGIQQARPALFARDAAQLGAALLEHGYLVVHLAPRTCADPKRFQEGVFYKMVRERDRYCLNSFCQPVNAAAQEGATAVGVVERLRVLLSDLQAAFITEAGVNYQAMRSSDQYGRVRLATVALRTIDLTALNGENALAFWMNVYNCLIMHGTLEVGHPTSAIQRSRFFNKVSYQMGAYRFSCTDIEHGILRCNRPAPGSRRGVFKASDPRLAYALRTFDPRIHFALNCGAKSCPPIRVYKAGNMERGLQLATEGFLADTVKFNEAANTVTVSKVFQWFHSDFAANSHDLLVWIAKFLPAEHPLKNRLDAPLKVVYDKYDWSLNQH